MLWTVLDSPLTATGGSEVPIAGRQGNWGREFFFGVRMWIGIASFSPTLLPFPPGWDSSKFLLRHCSEGSSCSDISSLTFFPFSVSYAEQILHVAYIRSHMIFDSKKNQAATRHKLIILPFDLWLSDNLPSSYIMIRLLQHGTCIKWS